MDETHTARDWTEQTEDAEVRPLVLLDLPTEALLHILTFLAVPDLLALSRTCRALRPLCLDPLLHRHRLQLAQHSLSVSLPHRPALASLRPPSANIYLTHTLFAARRVGRRLVGISLSKRLSRRPSPAELVSRGVLPGGCFVRVQATPRASSESSRKAIEFEFDSVETDHPKVEDRKKGEAWARAAVSPQLLTARRALERETVKDKLRRFLSGKGLEEVQRRRQKREEERQGVQVLARKFASREKRGSQEPRRREAGMEWKARIPARANVLRLRRFWETVGL